MKYNCETELSCQHLSEKHCREAAFIEEAAGEKVGKERLVHNFVKKYTSDYTVNALPI